MKLTKSQKKILKSIPNEKTRLEQKLQFKIQNRFLSREPIIFIDGKFETDNPQIIDFLSNHPMYEKEHPESQRFVMTPKGLVPMSDEISNMIDKGEFKTWYSTSAEEVNKRFDESANDNPKQFTLEDMRKIYVNGILDNQNLLVTPETCQITFDMHLRNVEKKQ